MKMDRQFQIGETRFEILKIPPMRAWEISELIREALGRPDMLMLDVPESDPQKMILAILAGLKASDVREIRDALFEFVAFKSPEQVKAMGLFGAEDMAFSELDFTAVYEVLGRAFYVNFTGSLNDLLTRVGIKPEAKEPASGLSPSEPGQSPLSSLNQSGKD